MPRRAWLDQLPAPAGARDEAPYCGDDGAELRDVRLTGASIGAAEVIERLEVVNVVLDRCDVAGLVATDGRADRVLVTGSRVRGVTWGRGLLRDIECVDVTGTDVSLRFSTLRRIAFRDCQLPGVDLTEVVFDDVVFERCDLRGAQLHKATVKKLRIAGCDLGGCSGAEALAGASIHPDDVQTLAISLAAAIGMRVESEP